ncbi:L-fucono-1,5-lactonase-like isoform X2 [Ptychodera flava]|uniref:L-fucono-1,5-lactonase-like isoform X2 n=1 Tax=Ptychodera flava TaxID=63121 RepID=UPI00396AA6DC
MHTASLHSDADFWDLQAMDYVWPTKEHPALFHNFYPEDLEEEMKESPFKNVIFVQVVNNTVDENYWAFDLAKKHKSIVGVVGWVDMTKPETVGDTINKLQENPLLVGFRHITELEDPDWLQRPDVNKSLSIIQDKGLTFDLLIRPPLTSRLVPKLARDFPQLKFIIDHIGKPNIKDGDIDKPDFNIHEWKEDMRNAAKYPNVYCKLSGLVTEADLNKWKPNDLKPFVQYCVEHFGADRCLFGSDYPVYKMANATYSQVFCAVEECLEECTDEEKSGIFGKNAVKFYNIRVPLNK